MQIEPKSVDTIAGMVRSSQLGCILVASDSIQGSSLMYIHTQVFNIHRIVFMLMITTALNWSQWSG